MMNMMNWKGGLAGEWWIWWTGKAGWLVNDEYDELEWRVGWWMMNIMIWKGRMAGKWWIWWTGKAGWLANNEYDELECRDYWQMMNMMKWNGEMDGKWWIWWTGKAGWLVNNEYDELESISTKEKVVASSESFSGVFLGGLSETRVNHSQDSRCPNWNSDRVCRSVAVLQHKMHKSDKFMHLFLRRVTVYPTIMARLHGYEWWNSSMSCYSLIIESYIQRGWSKGAGKNRCAQNCRGGQIKVTCTRTLYDPPPRIPHYIIVWALNM